MAPRTSWQAVAPLLARIFTWGALFVVLYVLRSFFLLIFLTFLFAYIQATGVDRLERFIKNRPVRVVLVGLALLTILVSLANYLTPHVREQAQTFIARYPQYLRSADEGLATSAEKYPVIEQALPSVAEFRAKRTAGSSWSLEHSPSGELLQSLFASEEGTKTEQTKRALEHVQKWISSVLAVVSAFLLSLLFSFLIVLDLPALIRSTQKLRETRLQFVYEEVADTIVEFGRTMGRAFQAQLIIALLNTILTAVGITMLGIEGKTAFLSVIVFICSFIPVAGVFISSLPICLLALDQGGFRMTILAALLITVIHMIEAYILNPKIYGRHLHLNPVIVLIILTVGGKLFHFWGLILGVPICTYLFGTAIQRKSGTVITSSAAAPASAL